MKTPEQLKGAIRNISKQSNLRPQEVLQMFLFERILERLSVSSYCNDFILKGGLLISSMTGLLFYIACTFVWAFSFGKEATKNYCNTQKVP